MAASPIIPVCLSSDFYGHIWRYFCFIRIGRKEIEIKTLDEEEDFFNSFN
jgi:hypothetical protein